MNDLSLDFSGFFERGIDVFCIAAIDGQILRINHGFRRHLGWMASEVVGHSFIDLVHPEDVEQARQMACPMALGDTVENLRLRLRRRDGEYANLSWSAAPAEDGRRFYAVARQTETQSESRERVPADPLLPAVIAPHIGQDQELVAVGRMAGRMAHDFNNLLTLVNGYSSVLLDIIEENDPNRDYVDKILEAGQRAAEITRQLLEYSRQHAGQLEFSDLILPEPAYKVPEMPPAQAEEPLPLPAAAPGDPTVLIVEDDAAIRELMTMVLRDQGYRLLIARDGEEGLELGLSQNNPIDLLITDVVMPRRDGMQLADALRQKWPEVAVLFVSGYAENTIEHAPQSGNSIFLSKPFGPHQLLGPVRELIQAKNMGGQEARK